MVTSGCLVHLLCAIIVGTRQIFKNGSHTAGGEIEHYKACLVKQGFLQAFGVVDFFDTYAHVARFTSIDIIYARSVMFF